VPGRLRAVADAIEVRIGARERLVGKAAYHAWLEGRLAAGVTVSEMTVGQPVRSASGATQVRIELHHRGWLERPPSAPPGWRFPPPEALIELLFDLIGAVTVRDSRIVRMDLDTAIRPNRVFSIHEP
jgi:hypothetical protein